MKLFEVLDTPVQFSWTEWGEDYREAKFSSNGINYTVTFTVDEDEDEEGTDQHEFVLKSESDGKQRTGMTGQGNAAFAFAGLLQVVQAYQMKAHPTEMMYTLSDNEPSRLKFYNRLGARFQKMGYDVTTKMEHGVKFWMLRK